MENKTSDKKPKTVKVKLSQISSIKSTYDIRTGKLVERVNERQVIAEKGSAKALKTQLENKIVELVEQHKMNYYVGNKIIEILRNYKINPRWKKHKPKYYIPQSSALIQSPTILQTLAKDIDVICWTWNHKEKLGFDDKQTKKLNDYIQEFLQRIIGRYPIEALQHELCRKFIEQNRMKWWYKVVRKNDDIEEVKKVPIEEIKKFYDEQVEKVSKKSGDTGLSK